MQQLIDGFMEELDWDYYNNEMRPHMFEDDDSEEEED